MTKLSRPTGFLLLDKPSGGTSHDMVAAARRRLGERKIGHAGTLDPMATGLLVLAVGPATRLLTFLVGQPKEYSATVRLGWATTTDDATGEPIANDSPAGLKGVRESDVIRALQAQVGTRMQRPSTVSAIRVGGRRAYDRVRAGEQVEVPAREVHISEIAVSALRRTEGHIDVDFGCRVSSGTYVRAIARDLGQDLGTGGHLTALRRTTVGPFSVDDAITLEELSGFRQQDLLPAQGVLDQVLPVIRVAPEQALHVQHGRPWSRTGTETITGSLGPSEGPHAVVAPTGELLAVVRGDAQRWHYLVVLPQ